MLFSVLYCTALLDSLRGGKLGYLRYGAGRGVIWLDNLHCRGSERSLSSCSRNSLAQHDCSHSEDVSIYCYSGKNSWYFSLKYLHWWPSLYLQQNSHRPHMSANVNMVCIWSPYRDTDSGSGLWIPITSKTYRELPYPKIHLRFKFNEVPISFSRDMSHCGQIMLHLAMMTRILQKIPRSRSRWLTTHT